jgi:glucokinase
MDQVIGVDLGGSAIKLGRFDREGECLESLTIETPQPAQPDAVLQAIARAVETIDRDRAAVAIGLGTPGPVDGTGRIAKVAINLDGWQDVAVADYLEAKTGKPTILANDANCAGLGEAWLGAGKRFRNSIMLTLGTGVGGAIILDGELFVGHTGAAGELGLITLNLYGHECHSGNNGSLEQHVSVQAIRRNTGVSPAELGHMAQAGNREALAFWETYGHQLGAGLASLIYVLTPEAIIIGGGISASAEFFLPHAKAEVERRVIAACRPNLEILVAELGNSAGMVGAAKLGWGLAKI